MQICLSKDTTPGTAAAVGASTWLHFNMPVILSHDMSDLARSLP